MILFLTHEFYNIGYILTITQTTFILEFIIRKKLLLFARNNNSDKRVDGDVP